VGYEFSFRGLLLLTGLLWLAGWSPGATRLHAQQPVPTFRSGVVLVPITAVVRDSRNRIVRHLKGSDFEVREDSQLRPIVEFRATENAPLRLALLFDTSGSMRGPNLEMGKAVVDRLLAHLAAATDEIALFTFDKALRQETPFTADTARVRDALESTPAWGLTSLYDAIGDTARRLSEQPSQRQAVVVITDGVDTSSTLTAADVSGAAGAIDVPVYVLAVTPARRPAPNDGDEDGDLSLLAHWTGGDATRVSTGQDVDEAIESLMAELRLQYSMAIESTSDSGWRRLEVSTTRKDLAVRARSGYFATQRRGALGY
jgi:VWFA-related protein